MGTVCKTITLTDQQDRWVKGRIAAGEPRRPHAPRNQGVRQPRLRRLHAGLCGNSALNAIWRSANPASGGCMPA